MQKFIATWRSVGNSPDLQIDLAGFVRLPAPSKFMTLTPLHLNVPFSMLAPSSGLMLIRVKDHTPTFVLQMGFPIPTLGLSRSVRVAPLQAIFLGFLRTMQMKSIICTASSWRSCTFKFSMSPPSWKLLSPLPLTIVFAV